MSTHGAGTEFDDVGRPGRSGGFGGSGDADSSGGAVAALDCGTNSTRLLVAGPNGDVIHREMEITRLGEKVDATRTLSPAAVQRTVAVLERYRRKMDELGVDKARMVATSAVRDAVNAEEFLSAAQEATGISPEILSGSEEGRLAFAGATRGLPDDVASGLILVVDIGGGSTELVVGRYGNFNDSSWDVSAVSLDIGCVRLTERFLLGDPPSPAEIDAARRYIDTEVLRAHGELPGLVPGGWVVGLAGTVATIAGLANGVDDYERSLVHHAQVSREAVEQWVEVLGSETASQRMAHSKLLSGRADVIVGGALVLLSVMTLFDRGNCLASEDDILDGLVASIS